MKSNLFQNSLKKKLSNWIAFLLLFYAIADASFLQYYCGNESLGISSYQVEANVQTTARDTTAATTLTEVDKQPAPDSAPELPAQHNDCIGSCTHVLLNNRYLRLANSAAIISDRQTYFLFFQSLRLESHPPYLFRPPRTI